MIDCDIIDDLNIAYRISVSMLFGAYPIRAISILVRIAVALLGFLEVCLPVILLYPHNKSNLS